MPRHIRLDIAPATETHCAWCPCLVIEIAGHWYCQAFQQRLKNSDRDRAHRLPECLAAEKGASK